MILIFDMDDTLFPERDFVFSAFAKVSEMLSPVLEIESSRITARLIEILDETGRGKVFDHLLKEHGRHSKSLVMKCVSEYRSVKPDIRLEPDVKDLLSSLRSQPLYLISDGNIRVQQNKVSALGLEEYFRKIILTHRFGIKNAKPSLYCFEWVAKAERCELSDLIYVADDPSKDFLALNRSGGTTVRVLTGRFANDLAPVDYDARYKISSLLQLPKLLNLLESAN